MKGHQAIKLLGEGFHAIRLTKEPNQEIQACIDLTVSESWDIVYNPKYPPSEMLGNLIFKLLIEDWEVGIFDEDTQSYKWFGEVENWEKPKISW
jgi:hypothetical protein